MLTHTNTNTRTHAHTHTHWEMINHGSFVYQFQPDIIQSIQQLRRINQKMYRKIPGQVIPKTQKMVLKAALLSTQHYKINIKDKMEQSRERSSVLPNISV